MPNMAGSVWLRGTVAVSSRLSVQHGRHEIDMDMTRVSQAVKESERHAV